MNESSILSEFESPGGFTFGVQGWMWGEPRPRTITFFLDNTAKVSDQHGRPIRGILTIDSKQVVFADSAPDAYLGGDVVPRPQFATHAQVVAALEGERVDWTKLTCAGWPQLPYAELVKLPLSVLPPVAITQEDHEAYLGELRKIRDESIRKDAMRLRREQFDARLKELQIAQRD